MSYVSCISIKRKKDLPCFLQLIEEWGETDYGNKQARSFWIEISGLEKIKQIRSLDSGWAWGSGVMAARVVREALWGDIQDLWRTRESRAAGMGEGGTMQRKEHRQRSWGRTVPGLSEKKTTELGTWEWVEGGGAGRSHIPQGLAAMRISHRHCITKHPKLGGLKQQQSLIWLMDVLLDQGS